MISQANQNARSRKIDGHDAIEPENRLHRHSASSNHHRRHSQESKGTSRDLSTSEKRSTRAKSPPLDLDHLDEYNSIPSQKDHQDRRPSDLEHSRSPKQSGTSPLPSPPVYQLPPTYDEAITLRDTVKALGITAMPPNDGNSHEKNQSASSPLPNRPIYELPPEYDKSNSPTLLDTVKALGITAMPFSKSDFHAKNQSAASKPSRPQFERKSSGQSKPTPEEEVFYDAREYPFEYSHGSAEINASDF